MDAEAAHQLTLSSARLFARSAVLCGLPGRALQHRPLRLMGLDFPNPVGLAAGLDKNGEYIDAMAALGFGFIEVGTVTPRPQPGNPRPRLFRLPQAGAIINRMGFNNLGVDQLVANVRNARYRGVLGINIGKNFDTPVERAAEDYVACMDKVYAHASYITINISSPNTKNLRQLQQTDELIALLADIDTARERLAQTHGKRVPIAVKIAPDLDEHDCASIAEALLRFGIDAVIATNTTLARDAVKGLRHGSEAGGLSGAPLRARATEIVRRLRAHLDDRLPIIGVGGVFSAVDAQEKLAAGASLVQIYSGLIYRGPQLVREIINGLA